MDRRRPYRPAPRRAGRPLFWCALLQDLAMATLGGLLVLAAFA